MADIPRVLIDVTQQALQRHAPFDRMDADSMRFLVGRLRLAYHARGKVVVSPDHGEVRNLYVIQRGHVRGEGGPASGTELDTVEYSEGECFPLGAVIGRRPTRYVYTAVEDTFCYELDADSVEELTRLSPPFQAFCYGRVTSLLRQSLSQMQGVYAQQTAGQQPMSASLRDLSQRKPVRCLPSASLRSALAAMQASKVGSIVVVDEAEVPVGIFTERDLLRLTVAGELDLSLPIEGRMTRSPKTLPVSANASEAAVLMARLGIRHVIVVEDGRLAGMVSERDLFALQRTSLRSIIHQIEVSASAGSLQEAAAQIRKLAGNMIAQGVGAEQLAQLISTLNDRLSCRVIELEASSRGLDGLRFCWISLGSEGRLEQTLSTDQDNGIIFSGSVQPEEARAKLLPFAEAVNRTLDACGYPLCKGNIMAGNPQWCLSLDEWRQKFGDWIRNPLPQALLNATIFFDFRPLWGEETLARELREWLIASARDSQRFLRAMAQNALESRPPLGMFANFVTSASDGAAGTIDLKAQGSRPFVDAARILALASGLDQTNTAARLRLAGEKLNTPREETEAAVDAFHFILLYRLRHQNFEAPADGSSNRVNPDAFNELDRRILKEAFRQARKLQSRLSLDYQL